MFEHTTEAEARKQILDLVADYCDTFHKKKGYKEGDRIPYASRVYDHSEMVNLVDSSLEFWLTSGRYTDEFPVTHVITPNGNETSIFLRLFSLAPRTVIHPVGSRRSDGTGIRIRPLKYAPVTDSLHFMISFTLPAATTSPP